MDKRVSSSSAPQDEVFQIHFNKAANGDEESFWVLIEPYGGLIYSVAFGILNDPEQAQDILHEAYISAFHSLNSLRNPNRLAAWLYSLTRNLCYNTLTKKSLANQRVSEIGRYQPRVIPINEVLVKEEELRQLEKAICALPEHFRIILGMKYMNNYTYKEIAKALDISIETVKSRLYEARKLLTRRMKKSIEVCKPESKGELEK